MVIAGVMNKEPIEIEIVESATILRFATPQTKNPLSLATIDALESAIECISTDKVVFTGSGDTFASGANLKEIAALDSAEARKFAIRGQNLMFKIRSLEAVSYAAIDGFCMGGALDLAMSCNVRIATSRSIFAHPGARLGIITGWGGTQLMPRLIGQARALEIFFTARNVSASEALNYGLIDQISESPIAFAMDN